MARLIGAALALLLLGAGCVPGGQPGAERNSFLATVERSTLLGEGRPLRGEPEFDSDRLPAEAAGYYRMLRASIEHPEQRDYIEALASSDNIYEYGRLVQNYVGALLIAFRFTGDLALLDRVDELMQLLRANLHDSWRGVHEGNESEGRDGYLNWVWNNDTSRFHQGKDLHEIDEMRSHALVAEAAWAFQVNRDMSSPGGVDYGTRSEFWLDYLRGHFEAKWRDRNDVAWPRFPFLQRPYVHPTLASTKYHYYMYRLTGESAYLDEAVRLSDVLFGEFFMIESATGPAMVWRRSIISQGGDENYLMPTDYSSLVIVDALSLHLEGFYAWAQPEIPLGLANMVARYIVDNGSKDFSRDIGGGVTRAGIPPSSPRDWERLTATQFSINSFSLLATWDPIGEIGQVSRQVYQQMPSRHRYPFIPTGLLVDALEPTPEKSSSM